MSRFCARLVFLTLAVQLPAMIAGRFMTSKWNLKTTPTRIRTALWVLAAIFLVLVLVALLVASYSGLLYLGVWDASAQCLGPLLEALKRIFSP